MGHPPSYHSPRNYRSGILSSTSLRRSKEGKEVWATRRRPIKCPSCAADISRDKMNARKPFPCPSCGKLLRIPYFYYPIPGVGALLLCGTLGYVFGLRDTTLLIFVAVLWFPITAFLFA